MPVPAGAAIRRCATLTAQNTSRCFARAAAASQTPIQRLVPSRFQSSSASNAPPLAVGIDLGTTQSCVAVLEGKEPIVIPDSDGHVTTPSIVALTDDGQRLVGHIAKRQAAVNPGGTFAAVKRLIGRQFDDDQVIKMRESASFDIVKGTNGEAWVKARDAEKPMSPSEVSGIVLERMKQIGEAHLGREVHHAVVTVPAYFNDSQRQATKNAGALAGLNVIRVINEPTAAALAYGFGVADATSGQPKPSSPSSGQENVSAASGKSSRKNIVVYDLGGGTFDVSILRLDDEGVFEVRATRGDTFLGGEDVDNALIEHVLHEFTRQQREKSGSDEAWADSLAESIRVDLMAMQRIREAVERAKIELDTVESTEVEVPFVHQNTNLKVKLDRTTFDEVVSPIVERTVQPCLQCMRDAELTNQELSDVILVGGMTRTPSVRRKAEEVFERQPNISINPLEAVARGAAIQAGVLTGAIEDVLLLDVTPLSLGIETLGGMFNCLIPRNTTIPTRKTETFTTGVDNQEYVAVRVFQGERPTAQDNQLLGEFVLPGIPPAPRGKPRIEVVFDIDANGIVNVSARDKDSGAEQRIMVSPTGGLTPEQIEEIIREAQLRKADDGQRQLLAEAVAQAEVVQQDVLENLERFKAQLGEELSKQLRNKVDQLTDDLKSMKEPEQIRQAAASLSQSALAIFQQASKRSKE